MTIRNFALVRIARLYPMYAIGSVVGLAALLFSIIMSGFALWKVRQLLPAVALAVFLLPRPTDRWNPSFPLNAPAWSLFFELAVNLAYALALPRLTNGWLVTTAVTAGAAQFAVFAITGRSFGDTEWTMFLALPRVIFPYALGCLFYRLWSTGELPKVRLPVWSLAAVFVVVTIVPERAVPEGLMTAAAITAIFPLIVVAGIMREPSGALARVARAIGNLSYPLYMIHVPLIMIAETGIAHHLWGAAPGFAVAIALSLVLSAILTKTFDPAARRILSVALGVSSKQVVAAPAL